MLVGLELVGVLVGTGVFGLGVDVEVEVEVGVRVRVRVTVGVAVEVKVGVKVGVRVGVGVSDGATSANLVGNGVMSSGVGEGTEHADNKTNKTQRHKKNFPLSLCVFVVKLDCIIAQWRPSSWQRAQFASRHVRAQYPRRARCPARPSPPSLRRVDRAAGQA